MLAYLYKVSKDAVMPGSIRLFRKKKSSLGQFIMGPTDPRFNDVVYLLRMRNGKLKDEVKNVEYLPSSYAFTSSGVSPFGDATISAVGRYNTAPYLTLNSTLGAYTGDFTFEFWYNRQGYASGGATQLGADSNVDTDTNYVLMSPSNSGGNSVMSCISDIGCPAYVTANLGQWYHHCMMRINGKWFYYTDGVIQSYSGGYSFPLVNMAFLKIGRVYGQSAGSGFFMDEIRVSKIARYPQGGFTRPTARFWSPQ